MKLYLFIIVTLLMTSCSDKLKHVKDEQGHVLESYQENEQGQKHGTYKRYDAIGNLIEEATYQQGKLDGIHQFYYPNGQLELVEHYDNDVITGACTSYYKNGKVKLDFIYENGVINGKIKKYYENGALMEIVQMQNNEENGPFVEYYENGSPKWEGQYLNGDNEFGLLKNYDESGKLIKKMFCDSLAVCRTVWTIEKGDIELKPLNLKLKRIE